MTVVHCHAEEWLAHALSECTRAVQGNDKRSSHGHFKMKCSNITLQPNRYDGLDEYTCWNDWYLVQSHALESCVPSTVLHARLYRKGKSNGLTNQFLVTLTIHVHRSSYAWQALSHGYLDNRTMEPWILGQWIPTQLHMGPVDDIPELSCGHVVAGLSSTVLPMIPRVYELVCTWLDEIEIMLHPSVHEVSGSYVGCKGSRRQQRQQSTVNGWRADSSSDQCEVTMLCTGHSLGGALAGILATELRYAFAHVAHLEPWRDSPVVCCEFGSPVYCTDESRMQIRKSVLTTNQHCQVYNSLDPVPFSTARVLQVDNEANTVGEFSLRHIICWFEAEDPIARRAVSRTRAVASNRTTTSQVERSLLGRSMRPVRSTSAPHNASTCFDVYGYNASDTSQELLTCCLSLYPSEAPEYHVPSNAPATSRIRLSLFGDGVGGTPLPILLDADSTSDGKAKRSHSNSMYRKKTRDTQEKSSATLRSSTTQPRQYSWDLYFEHGCDVSNYAHTLEGYRRGFLWAMECARKTMWTLDRLQYTSLPTGALQRPVEHQLHPPICGRTATCLRQCRVPSPTFAWSQTAQENRASLLGLSIDACASWEPHLEMPVPQSTDAAASVLAQNLAILRARAAVSRIQWGRLACDCIVRVAVERWSVRGWLGNSTSRAAQDKSRVDQASTLGIGFRGSHVKPCSDRTTVMVNSELPPIDVKQLWAAQTTAMLRVRNTLSKNGIEDSSVHTSMQCDGWPRSSNPSSPGTSVRDLQQHQHSVTFSAVGDGTRASPEASPSSLRRLAWMPPHMESGAPTAASADRVLSPRASNGAVKGNAGTVESCSSGLIPYVVLCRMNTWIPSSSGRIHGYLTRLLDSICCQVQLTLCLLESQPGYHERHSAQELMACYGPCVPIVALRSMVESRQDVMWLHHKLMQLRYVVDSMRHGCDSRVSPDSRFTLLRVLSDNVHAYCRALYFQVYTTTSKLVVRSRGTSSIISDLLSQNDGTELRVTVDPRAEAFCEHLLMSESCAAQLAVHAYEVACHLSLVMLREGYEWETSSAVGSADTTKKTCKGPAATASKLDQEPCTKDQVCTASPQFWNVAAKRVSAIGTRVTHLNRARRKSELESATVAAFWRPGLPVFSDRLRVQLSWYFHKMMRGSDTTNSNDSLDLDIPALREPILAMHANLTTLLCHVVSEYAGYRPDVDVYLQQIVSSAVPLLPPVLLNEKFKARNRMACNSAVLQAFTLIPLSVPAAAAADPGTVSAIQDTRQARACTEEAEETSVSQSSDWADGASRVEPESSPQAHHLHVWGQSCYAVGLLCDMFQLCMSVSFASAGSTNRSGDTAATAVFPITGLGVLKYTHPESWLNCVRSCLDAMQEGCFSQAFGPTVEPAHFFYRVYLLPRVDGSCEYTAQCTRRYLCRLNALHLTAVLIRVVRCMFCVLPVGGVPICVSRPTRRLVYSCHDATASVVPGQPEAMTQSEDLLARLEQSRCSGKWLPAGVPRLATDGTAMSYDATSDLLYLWLAASMHHTPVSILPRVMQMASRALMYLLYSGILTTAVRQSLASDPGLVQVLLDVMRVCPTRRLLCGTGSLGANGATSTVEPMLRHCKLMVLRILGTLMHDLRVLPGLCERHPVLPWSLLAFYLQQQGLRHEILCCLGSLRHPSSDGSSIFKVCAARLALQAGPALAGTKVYVATVMDEFSLEGPSSMMQFLPIVGKDLLEFLLQIVPREGIRTSDVPSIVLTAHALSMLMAGVSIGRLPGSLRPAYEQMASTSHLRQLLRGMTSLLAYDMETAHSPCGQHTDPHEATTSDPPSLGSREVDTTRVDQEQDQSQHTSTNNCAPKRVWDIPEHCGLFAHISYAQTTGLLGDAALHILINLLWRWIGWYCTGARNATQHRDWSSVPLVLFEAIPRSQVCVEITRCVWAGAAQPGVRCSGTTSNNVDVGGGKCYGRVESLVPAARPWFTQVVIAQVLACALVSSHLFQKEDQTRKWCLNQRPHILQWAWASLPYTQQAARSLWVESVPEAPWVRSLSGAYAQAWFMAVVALQHCPLPGPPEPQDPWRPESSLPQAIGEVDDMTTTTTTTTLPSPASANENHCVPWNSGSNAFVPGTSLFAARVIQLIKSSEIRAVVFQCAVYWKQLQQHNLGAWLDPMHAKEPSARTALRHWVWQSVVTISATETLRLVAFQTEASQTLVVEQYPTILKDAREGLVRTLLLVRNMYSNENKQKESVASPANDTPTNSVGSSSLLECLLVHVLCSAARLLATANSTGTHVQNISSKRPLPTLSDSVSSAIARVIHPVDQPLRFGLVDQTTLYLHADAEPTGVTDQWTVPLLWSAGLNPWNSKLPANSSQALGVFGIPELQACLDLVQNSKSKITASIDSRSHSSKVGVHELVKTS